MRRIIKKVSIIIGVIIVSVTILHVAFFTFVNAKGKGLIVESLKDNFGLEAAIESFSIKFPFTVEIKNFECEALSFKKANISLSFFNPFTRRLSLNEVYLDGLGLKMIKNEDGFSLSLPSAKKKSKNKEKKVLFLNNSGSGREPKKEKEPTAVKGVEPKLTKRKKFSFAIGNFYLKNSRVDMTYLVKKCPLRVVFDDITLEVKGFTYPKLSKFYVELDTVLLSPSQVRKTANVLTVEGWADYINKNMSIVINIDNLDYFAFSKCYPPFWQAYSLGLKEAVLSFESKLNSKDNNLTIDNFLTVEKIDFIKEDSEEEESFKAKTLKTIISYLKGDKDKPALRFKLITKMDLPKMDFSSLKESLKEVVQIGPVTIIEGAVDEVKKKLEGTGNATVGSVIETLKGAADTLKGIFKGRKE
ncbi:MAG: hypothetical protein KAT96_02125 [Candidatus Omnitrophica bacterium]|nr:hypothetical protein [Candidatus Omnitrophota bacterium]